MKAAFVTIIGDALIDVIVPIKNIKAGNTYYRKVLISCAGTANVAEQLSRLGVRPAFVGKVGKDILGRYFKQNLGIKKIKDLTFADNKNPTGLCISLVYENGEKVMIVNRGANDYIGKKEVRRLIKKIIASKIVYFSGYSLLSKRNEKVILYMIKECKKNKCAIYFNPGAPNIAKGNFKRQIYNYVDVLILNGEEAKNIDGNRDIKQALKDLGSIVKTVVITRGKHGCVISKEHKCFSVKAKAAAVLDTTGAGDAFSAGFIAGKLRGMNDLQCARLGNNSAADFLKGKIKLLK